MHCPIHITPRLLYIFLELQNSCFPFLFPLRTSHIGTLSPNAKCFSKDCLDCRAVAAFPEPCVELCIVFVFVWVCLLWVVLCVPVGLPQFVFMWHQRRKRSGTGEEDSPCLWVYACGQVILCHLDVFWFYRLVNKLLQWQRKGLKETNEYKPINMQQVDCASTLQLHTPVNPYPTCF